MPSAFQPSFHLNTAPVLGFNQAQQPTTMASLQNSAPFPSLSVGAQLGTQLAGHGSTQLGAGFGGGQTNLVANCGPGVSALGS